MRGPVPPEVTPVEGRRGAIYVGELYDVLLRNGPRGGQAKFEKNRWGKVYGQPEGACTLWIGRGDARKNRRDKLQRIWGAKHNVPTPMVPEFTIVEDIHDDHSEILKRGWRWLVRNWLANGILNATPEVESMLGRVEFGRALQSRALTARQKRR